MRSIQSYSLNVQACLIKGKITKIGVLKLISRGK